MADRAAELHNWLFELESGHRESEHAIARGARAILATIEQSAPSEYREMAMCKLTDAVITAAVACRQPQHWSQTAPKSG